MNQLESTIEYFRVLKGDFCSQRLKNSIRPHFEACKVCGQEYCMEPMHNLEEEMHKELESDTRKESEIDMHKEPQIDMNTSIQLNSQYLLKPQM